MTGFIGRSIYMGSGHNYTAEVLQECQDCGALVRHDGIEKHKKFHKNLEQPEAEEQETSYYDN